MAEADEQTFETVPAWQGFVIGAVAVSLYFALPQLVDEGSAWVAAMSAISIMASVRISWPLRYRPWFWAAVVMIALMHLALIFIPAWNGEGYPSLMLWPCVIADTAIIIGVFAFINGKFPSNERRG